MRTLTELKKAWKKNKTLLCHKNQGIKFIDFESFDGTSIDIETYSYEPELHPVPISEIKYRNQRETDN